MKTGIVYILAFLYALLDTQTVVKGALDGVNLALTVIVPSLFPFIFLSILCNCALTTGKSRLLSPLERICGMPSGSGSLLLLGFMGGYPIGAQNVALSYKQGNISRNDAERLIGFCNNAGPSFIFGMIGGILKDAWLCWLLWIGQIISAIFVGIIIPGKSVEHCHLRKNKSISVTDALEKAIHSIVKISGWVILFRIVICIAEKWFLTNVNTNFQIGLAGMLELTNGCVRLSGASTSLLQFIICGMMLSFGGICVLLQTKSVCSPLSVKTYIFGKALQTVLIFPILLILWKIRVAF